MLLHIICTDLDDVATWLQSISKSHVRKFNLQLIVEGSDTLSNHVHFGSKISFQNTKSVFKTQISS